MSLTKRLSQSNAACLVAAMWVTMTLFVNPSIEVGSVWYLQNRIDVGVAEGIIVFMAMYAITRMAAKRSNVSSYRKYLVVLSVALGAAQTIGANFSIYSAFRNPGLSAAANVVDVLFRFIGWSTVIFIVAKLALSLLEEWKERGAREKRASHWKFLNSKHFPLFAFLICLACWMPYLVVLFPGVVTSDTIDQINQGLGYTPLQDHHPFVHSIILGQLIGIGQALSGTIYGGIIVATLVQMMAFALICALCASAFEYPSAKLVALVFFAVHPVIAWYSVTLWKDVLYCGFILLFALSLFKLCAGNREGATKWLVILFVGALGTLIMKKSGLFIVAPAAVASIFLVGRGGRIRLGAVCAAAVLAFFAIQVVSISCFGVIPGKGHEAYSVPLQQMARTVSHHLDEIDEETARQIDAVLPYDKLGELYIPTLADPVKGAFDDDAFAEDPTSFVDAYLKLGFRYPGDYLNAFLNGTYGYWYPDVKYWMVTTSDYNDALHEIDAVSAHIYDENYGSYEKPALSEAKGPICGLINSLRSLPLVSCLFSIGFWVWTYCFLLVVALRNRLRSSYPIFIVAGLVWLTCLISPLYAEMRYAFSLLLMLPLASWGVLGQWLAPDRIPGANQQPA